MYIVWMGLKHGILDNWINDEEHVHNTTVSFPDKGPGNETVTQEGEGPTGGLLGRSRNRYLDSAELSGE